MSIVVGALALAILAILAILASACREQPSTAPGSDPLVEHFRSTERQCIGAFNAALGRQRSNEIDELGLAGILESDVLGPWREIRREVEAAPLTRPSQIWMYTVLRYYLEARETAWAAYEAALRSTSEAQSRPHYDAYHAKDVEADLYARQLGHMFRGL
jgi:hypothetical protein